MKRILTAVYLLFAFFTASSQTIIEADHQDIVYWGRIDFSNPKAPAFEYPGVTIRAKFTGTSIQAKIQDFAQHGETTTNYFYKIIDGGTPEKFEAMRGINTYSLASGLPQGSHTVEIIKLTEANVGRSAFLGFILDQDATLQSFINEPACNIEFIGNSITSGYGNEVSIPATGNPGTGFHSVNENNYKAWGYVAARKLNMRYRAVSYSGRGLYRNNTGSTTGTMPDIYDRIFPDQSGSAEWNHSTNHPDYMVINLGTNDFALDPASPVNQTSFENTYFNFVKRLKDLHPDAKIVLALGVMMNDFYPGGASHWTKIRAYVKNVLDRLNTSGFEGILYLEMDPQNSPYGEDYHPTALTHERMADDLVELIGNNPCGTLLSTSSNPVITEKSNDVIFPNPAENILQIKNSDSETNWAINANTGQLLISGKGSSADISSLSSGLYYINLNQAVYKFIKK